ncbi:MAG: hypothetical protein S4CHLAM6_06260 [Chlamydiae bacterium]|nr:hypothetical protein [Chlamydiota bacterium]
MSLPRFFLFSTVGLFMVIGLMGWMKKGKEKHSIPVSTTAVQEIEFKNNDSKITAQVPSKKERKASSKATQKKLSKEKALTASMAPPSSEQLPEANYIGSFFDPAALKLPIVETITYSRRVPWLKGKFAWVSDYASHYKTSKHFIARSLNKKADYFTQNVKNGDRLNVLRTDKDFYFYLLIDTSRSKMWFYYVDKDLNQRTLVKTYTVGLGRLDDTKASGSLTPIGKYTLGEKIAVYKPGVMGHFNNEKVEMVQIFGTRWIPFGEEIEGCTAPAKGFGLHGTRLIKNPNGDYTEDISEVGKFESDGCVRVKQHEMEELFAIIVSRPTVVELVKDFHEAKLPGEDKKFD